MALGRPRSSKRSSYTSYTSTVTTIVFIVLCVLGVWMLTSNSVTPLQTTKHTDSVVSKTSNNDLPAGNDKKDTPAYEDNPGELPDDAIKSDDTRQVDNNTDDSASSQDNSQPKVTETDTGASTKPTIDAASDPDKQPETAQETTTTESDNNAGGGNNDKDVGASTGDQENPQVKESIEQEAEKPNQNENQVTEESALTQGQGQQDQTNPDQTQIDQKPDEDQQQKASVVEDQPQESNNVASTQESSEDQQQLAQENESSNDRASNNEEPQPEQEQQQQQQQEQQQRTQDKLNEEQTATSEEDPGAQKTEQEAARDEDLQSQGPQDVISDEDRRKRIEEQQRQQRQEDQQTTDISGASSDESAQSQQQNMPDIINKEQESQFDDGSQQQQKQGQPRQTQSSSNETDSLMTKLGTGEVQNESNSAQSFPGNESSGIPKESKESKKSWSTQAAQSENQKERRQSDSEGDVSIYGYSWQLCNVTVGPDYIPCLDNEKALRQLRSTKHFEHRERHCPEDGTTCLVPIPDGYKKPIEWPKSREKIWYHNVPHPMLADVKGHQNWVKVTGEFLTFPGGGTQFIHGALHYIDFLQTSVPNIKWGKHTRVVLDVGCGVASFGGYLFERDVLTMSFAPKDEHEAQVQFALERGIPAISAVMGSKRLPFPSRVFDLVHCARCRVPWHAEGGRLLLELNRVLRPGGFFVWSATPVYQKLQEDVLIWKEMTALTASMCWELVTIQRDKLNSIGAAIYRKPRTNECYEKRKQNTPPMCKDDDDPNAAWYVPLQACMHRLPVDESERGARWPVVWPRRLRNPPTWLNSSQMGIYGKPAPQDFSADYEHWKRVVSTSYMSGLGISWSGVRNVMDMRAVYGGFAAALKDLQMWVLNVVNIDSPDTLPIIYERGLFGIYHDWCESFSTYPRTYDLLHADHLFSKLKKRCKLTPVMAEVDRIVRPGGKIIVRDESSAIGEVENLLKSMHWEVHLTFSKDQEGILSAQKGKWRPNTYADHL